jgi:membrane protein implicated in regulation of membrane protease activity
LTFVFLAILVMAWVIVFLPAVQRATKETPLRSAEHFRRGMQVIAPSYEQARRAREQHRQMAVARVSRPAPTARGAGRPAQRRGSPAAARSRAGASRKQLHRQALGVLLTLAGWSGIAALFLGGGYWELHLAIDASIGLYAVYLAEERRRAIERATKVRTLRRRPARVPQQQPVPRPSDIRLHDTWAAVEEG